MNLQFEHPEFFYLLPLLVLLVVWIARRSWSGLGKVRRWVVLVLRCLLIAFLLATLAKPKEAERSEDLTLLVVADTSYSVPLPVLNQLERDLREGVAGKENADRLAVITVGEEARVTVMPSDLAELALEPPLGASRDASHLAAGLRLATAVAPYDTASRILLLTDGLETLGSARAEAELCRANGIPVDVIPISYDRRAEVVFDRVDAPVQARPGQALNVRLVLRATGPAVGRIGVLRNGDPVDLNGPAPGDTLPVTLEPGISTFRVQVDVPEKGLYRWMAFFENEEGGRIEMPGGALQPVAEFTGEEDNPQNNFAEGITFVQGQGSILVIDRGGEESAQLVAALRASRLEVEVRPPGEAFTDLISLMGYDAIFLVNVPAFDLSYAQQQTLQAYVHDVGGGLVMVGGPLSFGAGGWIGSPVAEALPVKMDPPQTRQIPRGALAMIMHSTEMAQANYWTEQSALAAVNALTRYDLVGVIDFNWQKNGDVWEYPLSEVGDRTRVKQVIQSMPLGDMPSFETSMKLALKDLIPAQAGQKAIIIFSDGDASAPSQGTLKQCRDNKITVTTVMYAGHGTKSTMQLIAQATGGEFHHVKNPKKLPELFSKVAVEVQRSLIQEGEVYGIQHRALMGPTLGLGSALPPVTGYVLTVDRGGKSDIPMVTSTGDPAYAYWQYGLGKAIACTFDLNPSRWANQWVPWDNFEEFCERSARWVMRPSTPQNVSIQTSQEGDTVTVEARILTEEGEFAAGEQIRATILDPAFEADSFRLNQIGPGRYVGQFKVAEPGAYAVTLQTGIGGAETAVAGGVAHAVVAVPFSQEFRAVRSDNALLRDVAEITAGRYLARFNPQVDRLFDRTGLEFPVTLTDIWPLFA
ncbi:MAG: VWA domain-containing protein, partial [Phycisphaerales bacterium JB038]